MKAWRKENHCFRFDEYLLINLQQNIEDSLADLLLTDNMQIMELVCRSALVGDAAALASKGILKILTSRDSQGTQDFLKSLFLARISDYRKKQRDLSDITRDNSLITMLLVAYAKEHGAQFLIQTLTQTLNAVFPLLDKCEVDPQKMNNTNNTEEQILLGKNNLEKVCEKLFEAVFTSVSKVPEQILEMCRFLATATNEIFEPEPHQVEVPSSPIIAARPSFAKPRIFGKLKDRETSSPSSGVLSGSFQQDIKSGNMYLTMAESVPLPSVMLEKHESLQRAIRASVAIVDPEKDRKKPAPQSGNSIISSASVAMSVNTYQDKSKTLGNLSTSEKIIGSFLFLRFIVPGVTSPEANGIIVSEKINAKARRGLVLAGKMLTSLCNDNEFGNKDASLIPCNQFLIPYRQQMKQFLSTCAVNEDVKRDAAPSMEIRSHSKEKSGFNRQASFDILGKGNPLSKDKKISLSMNNLLLGSAKQIEKDPDIVAFYQQLFKSIDKLEKDVNEKRRDLSLEKAQTLHKRFNNLRNLLEKGGYSPKDAMAKKNPWYAFITKSFAMKFKQKS